MSGFNDQVQRLAKHVHNGELLAQTDVSAFVAAVADKVERLQAIVDRLPLDAEGNPVTPERELVSVYYGVQQEPRRVCEIRAGGWRFYGSSWYAEGELSRQCYGSTEAAEKARAT